VRAAICCDGPSCKAQELVADARYLAFISTGYNLTSCDQFRNRDRSNRSGRGQVEHNVLEGLPINQYKEVEVTIGPSSTETKRRDQNEWMPPMPRDSHLLPEHSQLLLRAARSGRIYKPPAPPEEDKDGLEEEDEHKEVPQGFTVKKWVKVPRHLEDAEPEYLAKRRKGLPSQYVASGQVSAQPAALRETKVKKTDAEGNVSVYKVLVPEGQAVEGEIQATDAVIEAAPVAAAPGTIVEGVGVVNAEGVVVANDILQQTPPRRRPAPPRKKKRSGPGRGKKKVVFVEGAPEQGTPASGAESGLLVPPSVKLEDGSVEPSEGGDTPMPDAGDEEEGSGEEGSEDEEQEEGTHSPTPALSVPPPDIPTVPTSAPAIDAPKELVDKAPLAETAATSEPPAPTPTEASALPAIDAPTSIPAQIETEIKEKTGRDPSSSPELPLSAMAHSRQNSLNQIPTLATLEASAPVVEPEPVQTEEPAQPEVVHPEVPAPVVEPAATPVIEPAAPPIDEPALGPVDVPAAPPVDEPAALPVDEPVAPPVDEQAAPPVDEPAAPPVDEPAAPSIDEPAAPPVDEPVASPANATTSPPANETTAPPANETTAPPVDEPAAPPVTEPLPTIEDTPAEEAPASDGELDLLGSLERQLDKDSESMAAP
jgi:hypothetical protein